MVRFTELFHHPRPNPNRAGPRLRDQVKRISVTISHKFHLRVQLGVDEHDTRAKWHVYDAMNGFTLKAFLE